jgi:hypothetical protein
VYETLIIDGTDLATVVSCLQSLDGLYAVGSPRDNNLVIPGVDGETYVPKPYAAGVIGFGVVLAGSSTAELNDSFRALKTLIQPGKRLSLERHLSYTAGNEAHVAYGEWASGLDATVSLMRFGRVTFSLKVLNGLWYSDTPETVSLALTTTVAAKGEARTHAITLTVDGGTTTTNTTTGHAVSTSAASGTPVVIDVLNMTATQGGTDVSGTLTWNKAYPFQLMPGNNVIVSGSSGSTLSYIAAYL